VGERSAGILGTGLIGTSIGLGLAASGWEVVGWDPNPLALSVASKRRAVTETARSEPDLLAADLDLLILAGPPQTIPETLARVRADTLVTDVAGIKAPVVAAAAHLERFVSSHPMAGREVAGPEAASRALFNGAAWVVVADGAPERDVEMVENVAELLGAHPVRMSAQEHDRMVTTVSHLPQVLACALIAEASTTITDLSIVGGSFRDLTRVAASDPAMWSDLLGTNKAKVADSIEGFCRRLLHWADLVEDRDRLVAALTEAARLQTALHPPVALVEVSLLDRPGELVAVGRALDHARVDVRDLQLRHAPYGGGGLLRVFVHDADVSTLSSALLEEGLTVARTRGGDR
jgi:prephenate dehydrogenase